MGIVGGGDVVSLRDQWMFSLLLVTLKGLGFGWANWHHRWRAFWPTPSVAICFLVNFHHLTPFFSPLY